MREINHTFRKTGIVLLVIGIIDIAVMIYCISNKISYSSSFNVFAVIAGFLLIKGSVKTARIVRWVSAFFIVAFCGMIILYPFTYPIDLITLQIKLNPVGILISFGFGFIFIAILGWLYIQLSNPESMSLMKDAGYKIGKPKIAIISGLSVVVLGFVFTYLFQSGESAAKAITLAQEKLGGNFKYHVSSISVSGNKGHAVVAAYDKDTIKYIDIQW